MLFICHLKKFNLRSIAALRFNLIHFTCAQHFLYFSFCKCNISSLAPLKIGSDAIACCL